MRITDHRIAEPEAQFRPSPNTSGPFGDALPDTIVVHYTGGGSAESSVRTLCNPGVKASAHLVVGRDGSVFQLVPFDQVAWHAGRSSYAGREGYNKFSIGIELDNAGRLTPVATGYESWFGRVYAEDDVYQGTHRNETGDSYWHRYTEAQIETVTDICHALVSIYGIGAILGHEEIAPNRKIDPGPAFPLDRFRERLLANDRSLDGPAEGPADTPTPSAEARTRSGLVTASKLNIRANPSRLAATTAPPLPAGTLVDILEEAQGWYRVRTRCEGWVAKAYVKT